MRRSSCAVLLAALTLPVLVTACGSSSPKAATTSAPAASPTSSEASTATTGATPVDPAAFSAGLGWFFTDSSATGPVSLPPALPPCAAGKLGDADADVIAGLKDPASSDKLSDAVGIRVFRASLACDRDTVQALFVKQVDLGQLGATASQQTCVMTGLLDKIAALDDTTATGSGGEATTVPFGAALDACVPLQQGLTAILSDPANSIPPASVDCIAGAAAKGLTWAQVVDKSHQDAVQAAMQAAAAGCTTGN